MAFSVSLTSAVGDVSGKSISIRQSARLQVMLRGGMLAAVPTTVLLDIIRSKTVRCRPRRRPQRSVPAISPIMTRQGCETFAKLHFPPLNLYGCENYGCVGEERSDEASNETKNYDCSPSSATP